MSEHSADYDAPLRHWWQRKPEPVYVCEVCKRPGVQRQGVWDYCQRGHTYVGERADQTCVSPPEVGDV